MSQLVEVTINDEDTLVVSAIPAPGNKEGFDLTKTFEHAVALRDRENPTAHFDDDPETFTVTFSRHVPKEESEEPDQTEASEKPKRRGRAAPKQRQAKNAEAEKQS